MIEAAASATGASAIQVSPPAIVTGGLPVIRSTTFPS